MTITRIEPVQGSLFVRVYIQGDDKEVFWGHMRKELYLALQDFFATMHAG